ncbi:MAG TPA: PIN domain-containing protein [Verrucomicrobiota bacterium]|nr:PIN domain-containing protein [Verrucomicrobiota bacterium]HNU51168.1 PIN domain-containing protein [Verrucomicrobiota bacterium]
MILPDLNLLLYAYNPHTLQHEAARRWWEGAMNGDELIGLPLEVAFGFIRVATNPRLGPARVALADARRVVESWLDLPQARVLSAGARHFTRVMDLMTAAMAAGPVLSDAILAVYAIEHRATLFTNDGDFGRFPGLKWENPLLR